MKIEVVLFFVNAFSPLCTTAGLSLWLGVSTETLASALDELTHDGLLARSGEGEAAVFSLAAEARASDPLTRLLELYDDETQREEVLRAME